MDGSRFKVWTRRRFGVAAGGVLALALELRDPVEIAAGKGKRRRRKRCKKLNHPCQPGNTKRNCCNTLICGPLHGIPGHRCCKGEGASCSAGSDECCLDLVCNVELDQPQGLCTKL